MKYIVRIIAHTEDAPQWDEAFYMDLDRKPGPLDLIRALDKLDVQSLEKHEYPPYRIDVEFYTTTINGKDEFINFIIEGRNYV